MKDSLSYIFPQTVKVIDSPINGKIKLVKFLGKYRIVVNNMLESGGVLEEIWKKGINKVASFQLPVTRILILGLGGGTAANLINQSFPKAKIVGVEIDPIMISLGKKYFGLDKIKNLKIIEADAFKAGLPRLAKPGFDLILVDLYIGDKIPLQAESLNYLDKLKKLLADKGIIIFNRLFYAGHRAKTEAFVKTINQLFSNIELVRTWSNLLIICRV